MDAAEMLNCKLPTINKSCWHKAFVLYMTPMASYGRTLARTRCSTEKPNATVLSMAIQEAFIKERGAEVFRKSAVSHHVRAL
jgi:hypothetical protein